MTFRLGTVPGDVDDITSDDIRGFLDLPSARKGHGPGLVTRASHLRNFLRFLFAAGPTQCRYRHCRGFASQGDGASFEGRYCHANGAARAIRAHAPKDEELHRIAGEPQAVQKRNFYQVHCTIRTRGNYCHEHSMAIEVERDSPT